MALTDKLTDIADAIRAKTGESDLLTLDEMPDAIAGISGGGSAVDNMPQQLIYGGNLQQHFSGDRYKWVIENYSNKMIFQQPYSIQHIFENCSLLPTVDVNIGDGCACEYAFQGCKQPDTINYTSWGLPVNIPYIKGKPASLEYLFYSAKINLPNDWFSYISLDSYNTSYAQHNMNNMFANSTIRGTVNMNMSVLGDRVGVNGKNAYYILPFNSSYALGNAVIDNLLNIPVMKSAQNPTSVRTVYWWSSICKRLTFQLNNNVPYDANWNKLTIDLSCCGWSKLSAHDAPDYTICTGYAMLPSQVAPLQIIDATSAAALADNPNRWTSYVEWSLYNKTSALETIATLPDLTSSGSTATIVFSGNAGANTSGGAINTMTAAEIAVATAKGWTITFV